MCCQRVGAKVYFFTDLCLVLFLSVRLNNYLFTNTQQQFITFSFYHKTSSSLQTNIKSSEPSELTSPSLLHCKPSLKYKTKNLHQTNPPNFTISTTPKVHLNIPTLLLMSYIRNKCLKKSSTKDFSKINNKNTLNPSKILS